MQRLLIALVLSGIIGGCAAGEAELQRAEGSDVQVVRELSLLKAELDALAQPAGVGDELWASLCAELERAVAAGAPASQGAVRAASQAGQPAVSHEYSPRVFHGENRLQTYHVLTGDYDENGEVNAADLVPLSQYYRESALPAARFPLDSRQYVIDGDANGEINISDVTVIGQHFKERAVAYNIYASENIAADFPHEAQASLIEPLHSVPFTGIHADDDKRRLIEFVLPGQRYSHYWLRLETGDGEAAPSALAFHGDEKPALAMFIEPWTQLSYDSASGLVIWSNRLAGDADSNGEINITDLTPIGFMFGQGVEEHYGLAPGETDMSHDIDPDMNRDLLVDNHDVLFVMSYSGSVYDGYMLYHSESSADLPGDPWDEESLEPVYTGNNNMFEGGHAFNLGLDATGYIWLRAYHGDQLGPVSAMLEL